MSAVNIPQKAGFVATPDEWDALVRIAENLAAQVVQRDAALREMQAERDAAKGLIEYWKDRTMLYLKEADQRAAAARKVAQWARRASKDADERYNFCQCDFIKAVSELDAARAEVARMRMALAEADKSAQMMADQFYEVSEGAYLIDPVIFDAHRQAIRIALRQPAPAQELTDDERCQLTCWRRDEGYHAPNCPIHGYSVTAPAQGQE